MTVPFTTEPSASSQSAVRAPSQPAPAAATPPREGAVPATLEIARLWVETLGGPGSAAAADPDENFFEAGGTSLLAARLAARLKAQFGCAVSAADILANPSIRALAGKLQGSTAALDRTASDQRAAMQRRAFSGSRPPRNRG